ncbi:MAG: ribosome maturation factor RimM [Gemmatimonadota bacterium]
MAEREDARPEPEHLLVGHVTKPHGNKGEVLVMPLTDAPEAYFTEGRVLLLTDTEGVLPAEVAEVRVERSRPFKKGLLVKLVDYEDREAIAVLVKRYLALPAAELRPLEEGEVFYHQLLGLEVETAEGVAVGRVREVYETDPAHLLEVEAADGKRHLVPFTERIVRDIALAEGRLVIEPPAGLLEL